MGLSPGGPGCWSGHLLTTGTDKGPRVAWWPMTLSWLMPSIEQNILKSSLSSHIIFFNRKDFQFKEEYRE